MILRAARAAVDLVARAVEHLVPMDFDFDFGLSERELLQDLSRCARPGKTYVFDLRDGGVWH